jgi:hypothetical protein
VEPPVSDIVSVESDRDKLPATSPQNTEGKHFTIYFVMIQRHILGFFQQFTNCSACMDFLNMD